jgi:hypothetical protein
MNKEGAEPDGRLFSGKMSPAEIREIKFCSILKGQRGLRRRPYRFPKSAETATYMQSAVRRFSIRSSNVLKSHNINCLDLTCFLPLWERVPRRYGAWRFPISQRNLNVH